jgi:transcriptional regulator with XRE-family HTH domain
LREYTIIVYIWQVLWYTGSGKGVRWLLEGEENGDAEADMGRGVGIVEEKIPNVGPRIRAIREARQLSLRGLAERSHLSVNAISMIERGENSPTVSSLHSLARALGVGITDFFEDPHEQAVVFVRRESRLAAEGPGLVMESLGIGLRNQQLEPFLVTVEPQVGDPGELVAHPGQEFVYCLTGEVCYWVGGERYRMKGGDSLLFEAVQPHCFENIGDDVAQLLLVFQAVDGGHLARQRHFGA